MGRSRNKIGSCETIAPGQDVIRESYNAHLRPNLSRLACELTARCDVVLDGAFLLRQNSRGESVASTASEPSPVFQLEKWCRTTNPSIHACTHYGAQSPVFVSDCKTSRRLCVRGEITVHFPAANAFFEGCCDAVRMLDAILGKPRCAMLL